MATEVKQPTGAEWLRATFPDKPVSDFGARVANLLDVVCRLRRVHADVERTDWGNPREYVEFVTRSSHLANLGTVDCDGLTALVVLCHDARIRLEVSPCVLPTREEDVEPEHREAVREFRELFADYGKADDYGEPALKLQFHPRALRAGSFALKHPTLEQAVAGVRARLAPVAQGILPADEQKTPN